MKHTILEKKIITVGYSNLEMWDIRTIDNESILASTHIEHLAHVIQQAIENDIDANEKSC